MSAKQYLKRIRSLDKQVLAHDEEVLKALTGKAATQNDLMEAVKARIEQYKRGLK
jgi:uncharacterized membrane protein YdfJ with MMPL/SSD domain